MVDSTLATGYEVSQCLFSFSGPSQPTLDLNAGASVDELNTVEDTLATEYELNMSFIYLVRSCRSLSMHL